MSVLGFFQVPFFLKFFFFGGGFGKEFVTSFVNEWKGFL